jgi:hypothetical protein
MKVLKIIGAVGASAALLTAAGTAQLAQAATPSCAALDDPIYQLVNPTLGSSLLTAWTDEATKAVAQGFTQNLGTVFKGSTTAAPGLVGVHRLYNTKSGDFFYTASTTEASSAVSTRGYTDKGISFYVSPTADSTTGCSVSVSRLVKGTQHRTAASAAAQTSLTTAGWTLEKGTYYGGPVTAPVLPVASANPVTNPAGTGSAFQFAVVPDTQLEVLQANDTRLKARNQWLAQQKVSFVAQTGDLVNWDTAAHEQYAKAKDGMNVLTAAATPYTVAVGNHDTAATAPGGSAAAGKTWELVRDTRTLNQYFSAADFGNVGGAFEPGKIDNVFATYQAGGKKFMVITLEFCARAAVIEWARGVVASHPDYNVIISTHSYLNGDNTISTSNGGYGSTTPKYVYDRLVSQYPNIKMVFSGHVGYAAKARVDTGVNGNKIYSFLTTFHEGQTNPVRMLKVDTAKGTLSSTIYAPYTNKTWTAYDQTITGVNFI